MKNSITVCFLTSGLALGAAFGAMAEEPARGIHPAKWQWASYDNNWYLRGDISYNFSGRHEDGMDGSSSMSDVSRFDYNDAVGFSLGVGGYLAGGWRWDVGYDRVMSSSISRTVQKTFSGVNTSTVIPTAVTVEGTEKTEASFAVDNFMANGYFDLANFSGITPYLGAGIGAARVEHSQKNELRCTPPSDVYCLNPTGNTGSVAERIIEGDNVEWMLSYALTAGASIAVSRTAKFDISYQYLNIGDGSPLDYDNGTDEFGGVGLHRIKAGFRFDFR